MGREHTRQQTQLSALRPRSALPRTPVVSYAHLKESGIPPSTIRDRCRPGGRWQWVLPQVVALHNGPVPPQQRFRAAVLYASGAGRGPGPVITGAAALALQRVRAAPREWEVDGIDVLVPQSCGKKSHAWVRLRRTRRMPQPLRMAGALPVAPRVRAVVDAVRADGLARWAAALHELVQAHRVRPEDLAAELRAERLLGVDGMRALLEDLGVGVRSPAESLARRVFEAAPGVPQPLWNVRIHLDGVWLADPDAYWPRHGVIFEVDSVQEHHEQAKWERTMARHNRIAATGLKVLHASPRQLRTAPEQVMAALRAALASGPHGPIERVTVKGVR
ncbi:hypothetical protein ACH40E_05960 [Streptomyces acidicola]|uniref:hypothetical protein n=1 Tax=Streptomyces acidicola TaxID=2596892 RepID=UPI0037926562